MSEDPKGFAAGDYNLFRYCKNDPEDLTDPMGLTNDGVYQVDPRPPPPPSFSVSYWVLAPDNATTRKQFNEAQRHEINKNPEMKGFFDQIKNDPNHAVKVVFDSNMAKNAREIFQGRKNGDCEFHWDPTKARKNTDGSYSSAAQVLGHEVSHAARFIVDPQGTRHDFKTPDGPRYPHQFGNLEDKRVITGPERHAAIILRAQGWPEGIRDDGQGVFVPTHSVVTPGP